MMKYFQISCLFFVLLTACVTTRCKSKKLVTKTPAPVSAVATTPLATAKPDTVVPPAKQQQTAPAPVETAPDLSFQNIQFEFNSAVLKTDAYPVLDAIVATMKRLPSARFMLNGHASSEGTAEHNMELSIDRANAVKAYLVNGGVNADNLSTKGYGDTQPLYPNTSEKNRELNRRVEIKPVQ